jgi:hypothetical protein
MTEASQLSCGRPGYEHIYEDNLLPPPYISLLLPYHNLMENQILLIALADSMVRGLNARRAFYSRLLKGLRRTTHDYYPRLTHDYWALYSEGLPARVNNCSRARGGRAKSLGAERERQGSDCNRLLTARIRRQLGTAYRVID